MLRSISSILAAILPNDWDSNAVHSFQCAFPYLLLLALDWAKFGLTVGSREQTAFLLVLVLYIVCWAVTMIAAREKPHRVDRCHRPWTLAQALCI